MNLAENIVDVLLETADQEPDIQDLIRSIGLGYTADEFIFDWRQQRYCGRWSTGVSSCYVSWKKFTRTGRPIFLGVINRVERDVNARSLPVANEGKFYIESVPHHTRMHVPRGIMVKRGQEHKFTKTYYGYGAVKYMDKPETYTRYFNSATEAAGYLASLVKRDKRLRSAEMSNSA